MTVADAAAVRALTRIESRLVRMGCKHEIRQRVRIEATRSARLPGFRDALAGNSRGQSLPPAMTYPMR